MSARWICGICASVVMACSGTEGAQVGAGGEGGSGGTTAIVTGAITGCIHAVGGATMFAREASEVTGQALVGATISVDDAQVTATTGGDGCFLLAGAPAGQSVLRVNGEDTVPVTVIGEATVNVGATPVPRSDAIVAMEEALGARDYNSTDDVWILATQQPLPVGVTLHDALARSDDAMGLLATVASPSWFVYADPFPSTFFAHPTLFLLIDAESGDVTELEARSWPHLNGFFYYGNVEYNLTSPDTVVVPGQGMTPASVDQLAFTSVKQATGTVHGLVVQADSRPDFKLDADRFEQALGAGDQTKRYQPPDQGLPKVNARSEISALFAMLSSNTGPEDKFVVTFHTHGLRSGYITLQQEYDEEGSDPSRDRMYSPAELPWETVKAESILVILDVCHAKAVANRLESVFDKPAFSNKKVLVIAAAAEDEVAGAADDRDVVEVPIVTTEGGYLTTAVLEELDGNFCAEHALAEFDDIHKHVRDRTLAVPVLQPDIIVNGQASIGMTPDKLAFGLLDPQGSGGSGGSGGSAGEGGSGGAAGEAGSGGAAGEAGSGGSAGKGGNGGTAGEAGSGGQGGSSGFGGDGGFGGSFSSSDCGYSDPCTITVSGDCADECEEICGAPEAVSFDFCVANDDRCLCECTAGQCSQDDCISPPECDLSDECFEYCATAVCDGPDDIRLNLCEPVGPSENRCLCICKEGGRRTCRSDP